MFSAVVLSWQTHPQRTCRETCKKIQPKLQLFSVTMETALAVLKCLWMIDLSPWWLDVRGLV